MHSRSSMARGGVCVLIKDSLCNEFEVKNVSFLNLDKHFESVAVCIPKMKTIVVAIYRSPDGNVNDFFERFEDMLKILIKDKFNIIICGDFNIHFWSSSREDLRLFDLIDSYNLRATITDVTRPNESGGSCIDNIITNVDPDCCSTSVLSSCVSDHDAQVISFIITASLSRNNVKQSFSRNFSQDNKDGFCEDMSSINWIQFINKIDSDDQQYSAFHELFLNLYNRHFPLLPKRSTGIRKHKWLSPEILKAKEELRDWYHLRRDFPEYYTNIYLRKKQEYRRLISVSKAAAAERHIASSKNVGKAVWEVVKGSTSSGASGQLISEIESNGCILSQPEEIALAFNDHFINSSITNSNSVPSSTVLESPISSVSRIPSTFFLTPASEEEVVQIFNKLNNSKSRDIYDVSSSFLKTVSHCLTTPLTILFNNSLSQGVFPSLLKTAKVIPVFKKGEKLSINNYRPISILPSFSKIFERLMYNRLMDFLIKHSIITQSQFGFLKGKSTSDAINSFFVEVLSALDRGE